MIDHEIAEELTPPQIAKKWGVKVSSVLALIHEGELLAFNIAVNKHGRPRFKIPKAELTRFELSRLHQKAEPEQHRIPRRRKAATSGRDFF